MCVCVWVGGFAGAGKTSLSDRLLAVNGLVSDAAAGKVRFLDSRRDEQARQITIKSSLVSLLYCRKGGPHTDPDPKQKPKEHTDAETSSAAGGPKENPKEAPQGAPARREMETRYIINLIDCPGHVDFASEVGPRGFAVSAEGPSAFLRLSPWLACLCLAASVSIASGICGYPSARLLGAPGGPEAPPEPPGPQGAGVFGAVCAQVSAAVRLCDGCLLLVDAVEGVCSQTTACLSQALKEGLVPLLVLTKFDRLITKLQLTPAEAFARCQAIIEQVNLGPPTKAGGPLPRLMKGVPRGPPRRGLAASRGPRDSILRPLLIRRSTYTFTSTFALRPWWLRARGPP